MSDFKRGDHVFNNGLRQSLRDISALAREVLRADPKQKKPDGASERASRLGRLIADLDRGLSYRAFDLTVAKAGGAAGGDANSRQFGTAKQQFVWAFRQFLEAVRHWDVAKTPAESQSASAHLKTACLSLQPTITRWAQTAVDLEALKLLDAADKRLAEEGQKYLAQLRDDFIKALKYYQP